MLESGVGVKKIPKFLVLAGDGINCERETARAFEQAGAESVIVHINDLLDYPKRLQEFQGMALPGGFSFGDELGSGQILALKIRHGMGEEFQGFVEKGAPVIGICNGFQVLAKLGMLPFSNQDICLSLAPNESGHFIDTWVELEVDSACRSPWVRNFPQRLSLPIRHGEGRVVFSQQREQDILSHLIKNGQIPLRYSDGNPNGSAGRVAAICDERGLILGMMPHPEAAVSLGSGMGKLFFGNIISWLEEA